MKKLIPIFLGASLCFGAGIPSQQNIHGDYIEARTADVFTGPCFANSEGGLVGELAVFGWKIEKGSWQGVSLDGLSVVGAVKAKSTLGDVYHPFYPVQSVLIVDDKATAEQRVALRGFAQKMGGDLLQNIVRVESQPISLTFKNNDLHSMQATLTAGSLATIQTRALNEGDHLCRNEEIWYEPLSKTTHAMPVFALAHNFKGAGLGVTWSSPEKRSSFVGNFSIASE